MVARTSNGALHSTCGKRKIHRVMGEFKRGTLTTKGGGHVKSRAQAVAIALSSARRECGKKKKS